VDGVEGAVNPAGEGTKCAAWSIREIPPGGAAEVWFRLARKPLQEPFAGCESLMEEARAGADSFYSELQSGIADADARLVQRQAFAGMIWSKQYFYYDVPQWLGGDSQQPAPPATRRNGRNAEWRI